MNQPPPMEVSVVTAADWQRSDAALLLDVRTPAEVATACIESALLIPMQEIAQRVSELEPYRDDARPIVVFCHHGMRSLRVTAFLREQGFAQAVSMAGGIDAWSLAVDPAVARY